MLILTTLSLSFLSLSLFLNKGNTDARDENLPNNFLNEKVAVKIETDERSPAAVTLEGKAAAPYALEPSFISASELGNSELDRNIGMKLDANLPENLDVTRKPVTNLGESLDANNPTTEYTAGPPLELGEEIDADNPHYFMGNEQFEPQNIGSDMIVGQEYSWRPYASKNIGSIKDADSDVSY